MESIVTTIFIFSFSLCTKVTPVDLFLIPIARIEPTHISVASILQLPHKPSVETWFDFKWFRAVSLEVNATYLADMATKAKRGAVNKCSNWLRFNCCCCTEEEVYHCRMEMKSRCLWSKLVFVRSIFGAPELNFCPWFDFRCTRIDFLS